MSNPNAKKKILIENRKRCQESMPLEIKLKGGLYFMERICNTTEKELYDRKIKELQETSKKD